jgi:hypothetical protein
MFPRRILALAAASFATALPGLVLAASPLIVTAGATVSLEGDKTYSELRVEAGGTLRVKAKTSDGAGLGYLHIRANRVVIEAGGVLAAGAAGYRGHDDAAGDGEAPANGGQLGAGANDAGGGGAYRGAGGLGFAPNCTLGTTGGAAYSTTPALGSAGGAANVPGTPGTRGGHGGGYIVLEAAEMTLLGTLDASGENGTVTSQVGSGGGAGGAIVLVANALTIDAATTLLLARGGAGGLGQVAIGGGGGGGLIALQVPGAAMVPTDVLGGLGAAGCAGAGADGGAGFVDTSQGAPSCLDLDGDGFPSALCPDGSGTDCDDSDPEVRPDALERCDGVDQNCDGAVDEELPATACGAGLVCQDGACAEPADAGVDAGPSNEPVPAGITLDGGCQVGGGASPAAAIVLAMAGGFAAIRRTRRRRVR